MSDDSAFVQAILSNFGDNALRLVYADWLEERGDPRGEFLRLDVEFERLPTKDERRRGIEARMDELRPRISLIWQALTCWNSNYAEQIASSLKSHPVERTGSGSVCPNPICGGTNPQNVRHCVRCTYPLPLAQGSLVAQRYRIEEQLALGGFGYIYRAFDLGNNRPVALKELTAKDSQDFSYLVPSFRQEAAFLKDLQSFPIVPRYYDFIEQEQAAYQVLEYVGRESIAGFRNASNDRPFPFDWVVEVGKQLCDLLDFLHTQSPPVLTDGEFNLHLLPDQQTVKVFVDFIFVGLIDPHFVKWRLHTIRARLRDDPIRTYNESMAVPAERIIGRPEPRSDLFSLAGVLYQLLTGRYQEGGYTSSVLRQLLASHDRSIAAEQRWLYELIAMNLSEDVEERSDSARDFLKCLENRAMSQYSK
jgi:uncharacterized protein (TIGR02996 family)